MTRTKAKRIADLLMAGTGLIVLLPLLLVVSATVFLTMGAPVLFTQKRIGLHGKPFCLYKFRTMSDSVALNGDRLPDSQRITRLGRVLRETSIDELPTLVNVLLGPMSVVGPRPLLPQYLERYTPEQARRHEVKPGITGWAQANGRNALTWEEKFCLDVWYVDNWSLWLDLKILFMTIGKVLKRDGISSDGHATMPEFMGTKQNSPGEPIQEGLGTHGGS